MVRLIHGVDFDGAPLSEDFFLPDCRIIRAGVEPTRSEILTGITGCDFDD